MLIKEKIERALTLGYSISKEGKVKGPKGDINGYKDDDYLQFSIRGENKKIFKIRFHKFQAYMKFGDRIFEKGLLVRHLDGNSLNNSWDNLELGNQQQNMLDRKEEDRKNHSKNSKKLPQEEKEKIAKDKKENGLSYRQLSKKYNIPLSTLKDFLKKLES